MALKRALAIILRVFIEAKKLSLNADLTVTSVNMGFMQKQTLSYKFLSAF